MENLKEKLEKAEKVMKLCANSFDDNVRINIAKAGFCLDSFIYDKNPFVRRAVVDNGYKLHEFAFDSDPMVREGVANQGFNLDLLVYDKDLRVRKAAAKSDKLGRKEINILVKDKSPEVRLELAKRGEKLSILYKDPSPMVRATVAEQGYKLNILAKDENPHVRIAVARQGYELKRLLKDEDENVVKAAKLYGFQHEDAISEWVIKGKKRVCSICGYSESKYSSTAKQRCKNCNFVMSNFSKLPYLADPETRRIKK